MKKQTKVMATLSTAALLALGFSAVSMAAGWDNSTGAWRYLNNDGTEVVDEWKSANGNWFYLDSDGVMATDKLIEDTSSSKGKTKYYYVDQYGAMVKNTWKAVAMDGDDDELDAEYWWYYFGNDGKAYTTDSTELTKNKLKTINGLKYAFNEDGHMLYGWTDKTDYQNQDDTTEDSWTRATYYLNGWNDGHAQTGWAQLAVEDDGETKNYWFWFDSNGVKAAGQRKKINGAYYVFANDGHMVDEWVYQTSEKNASWSEIGTGFDKTNADMVASISYVNGDGSQRKNTWVYAIPDEDWIKDDFDGDEYRWFYFGKNGKITVDQKKKINGKYYAFDKLGRMVTGFVTVGNEDGSDVEKVGGTDDFTRKQWIDQANAHAGQAYYFFSNDEEKDGAMKTGYQTIEMDDDTYQFYFDKNGKGITGYSDKCKKFLAGGLILKPAADDDNNYAAVKDNELFVNYNDIEENKDYILVNKQGTKVCGKTVKDENDQYWLTNSEGVVIKKAPNKDVYDKMRDDKNWN